MLQPAGMASYYSDDAIAEGTQGRKKKKMKMTLSGSAIPVNPQNPAKRTVFRVNFHYYTATYIFNVVIVLFCTILE